MDRFVVEADRRVVGIAIRVPGGFRFVCSDPDFQEMDRKVFHVRVRVRWRAVLPNWRRHAAATPEQFIRKSGMDVICPSAIDSLVHIWTALHKDLDVEIDGGDARYLSGVVLGMDDELIARLLAAKLAMSRTPDVQGDPTLARCGSDVAYSVQGRMLQATLVHGTEVNKNRLGVGTRFGAALLGLRAGQSLLWPMELGRLVEVRALKITLPSVPRQRRAAHFSRTGKPCVFG